MAKLFPVQSTALSHIGYEDGNLWVRVRQSGAIYIYLDVPQAHYTEMLAAPSIGAYWNQHIKPFYRFRHGQVRSSSP
jgi:hypothetical protein